MKEQECIAFKTASQWYAIDTKYTVELIVPTTIVAVSGQPDYVIGLTKFKEGVIPIVDIQKRMSGISTDKSNQKGAIVLNLHGLLVGISLEDVKTNIFKFNDSEICSPRNRASPAISPFLKGVAATSEVFILDMNKVINDKMTHYLRNVIIGEFDTWHNALLLCQKELRKLCRIRISIFVGFALLLLAVLVWGYVVQPPLVSYAVGFSVIVFSCSFIIHRLIIGINNAAKFIHKNCLCLLQIRRLFF